MDKQKRRLKLLLKRKSLSFTRVDELSREVQRKTLELKLIQNAKKILLYLPILNEVQTNYIIDELTALNKEIFVVAHASGEYFLSKFTSWQELELGKHGILQPKNLLQVKVSEIDLAILPGVAFDLKGNRLGYGKGVLDRILVNMTAVKIGLAYDFQMLEELPTEKRDVQVNIVVTEKKVYEF